jgi:oxygen-dependent protoporphyrinogen oxidase
MRVVVVGGGITGLTAAYVLGRAGVRTTLVESSGRLGGKVRTDEVDGFLVESGPDSFVSYRPAALELCRELGLGASIIRPLEPRIVDVRTGGRFVRLPEGMGLVLPTRMRPFVTTRMFSWLEKARMGLDLVLPREPAHGDVAVGPFLRRRLGKPLVDRLAGPLIGGVYGTAIDELSLDAVVPQLREAERDHRSLLLASLAQGRQRRRAAAAGGGTGAGAGGGGTGGRGSPFVTLAGGTGQLTGALAAAVRAMPAVDIRLDAPIAGLERRGPGFDVRLVDGTLLRPDVVVLTTPAPIAAGLLDPLEPEAAARLRSIQHGSTGVVTLAYQAGSFREPPAGHGFLVADDEPLSMSACTFSSLKWAGRAPEGTVLLRVFIPSRSDALLRSGDEAVIAAARRDLETTIGLRAEPILARVARWTDAMPHYTVGHIGRVDAAFAALARAPGLILAGAAYRGVGLPDCIVQGRTAAEGALGVLAGAGSGPTEMEAGDPSRGARGADDGQPGPAVSLDRLSVGVAATVVGVGDPYRKVLAGEGVRPGVRVTVASAAPFGGPVVLDVGRARVAVGRSVAATVDVAPIGVGPVP